MDGWLILRFLHLLGLAFFIGGQLMLATIVVPVERRAPDRQRLRAVARRFGWGTLAALAVLLATGIPLASHFERWGDSVLQAKLALMAVAAVLIVWHMRSPARRELDAAIFLV